MKFKSLFLSGFGCVACHTINHETKTNTFRLILIYGENRNSGALENQLQSFRIFFSIMYLDGFFEPTKVKSLFLSVIGSLVKQTFDLETEINVFTDLVLLWSISMFRRFEKSVPIFPNNFFIMVWEFISHPTKFESLFVSMFCFVVCQTVHPTSMHQCVPKIASFIITFSSDFRIHSSVCKVWTLFWSRFCVEGFKAVHLDKGVEELWKTSCHFSWCVFILIFS